MGHGAEVVGARRETRSRPTVVLPPTTAVTGLPEVTWRLPPVVDGTSQLRRSYAVFGAPTAHPWTTIV
jgi:hypothetical protein